MYDVWSMMCDVWCMMYDVLYDAWQKHVELIRIKLASDPFDTQTHTHTHTNTYTNQTHTHAHKPNIHTNILWKRADKGFISNQWIFGFEQTLHTHTYTNTYTHIHTYTYHHHTYAYHTHHTLHTTHHTERKNITHQCTNCSRAKIFSKLPLLVTWNRQNAIPHMYTHTHTDTHTYTHTHRERERERPVQSYNAVLNC